ncbi:MAG TPA: DUF4886 domain-containing protein [Lunatimonas sp.]|nr:DUF4886 domain-containing protein [Lunatimonas sp.]
MNTPKAHSPAKFSLLAILLLFLNPFLAHLHAQIPDSVLEKDRAIKILAIGNSFSEDAIENYLFELAESEGISMQIGNLYIGGAPLAIHWKHANENNPAYTYRKIEVNGNKSSTPNTALADAIKEDDWDYISFQQVSSLSGVYDSYGATLPSLLAFVRQQATNPDVKFIIHQTWAYAQNSKHEGFVNYGGSQEKMYDALVETYRMIYEEYNFNLLIPSGTAIQNGRNTVIGDNFTRDGYHLDMNIGRYTAACTWFESLTGKSVVGNRYHPENMSELEKEIAQVSAHNAVVEPDRVTITDEKQALQESL